MPRPLPATRTDRHARLPAGLRWRSVLWYTRPLLILTGLLCVLVAVISAARPARAGLVTVWSTTAPAMAGQELDRAALAATQLPAAAVPPGAITEAAALTGRRLLLDVPAHFPLSETVLSRQGLGDLVPDGRVVIVVEPSSASVAALVRPGDRVDLILRTAPEPVDSEQAEHTGVAAHGALVLPAGLLSAAPGVENSARDSTATGQVPLLVAVTPQEATTLASSDDWARVGVVLVE